MRPRMTITSRVESWGGPVWLPLALLEQCEMFAQEEVLGSECAARPGDEDEEVDEIARYGRQRREALGQRSKD